MKSQYTSSQKQTVVNRYLAGESVPVIWADTGIPRSTIYAWIKKHKEAQEEGGKAVISAMTIRKLENKIKRMEGIIEILQRVDCKPVDPLEIRLYELEKLHDQYSVRMLCDALKVDRGTFYNHMLRNKRDNAWYAKRKEELRIKVQEVYDDSNQIFGAAKITAVLKSKGNRVSVGYVRELMRDMGLISIRQDSKDIYDKESRKHKNYLNQQFNPDAPNKIWVSDITYFRFNEHIR